MPRNLLLALACSFTLAATAQPTWRFHLAFEDATGARDTLWFVFDTTATIFDVDPQCGEGGVTLSPDSFHVFMFNQGNDSTQTDAQPYTYFPEFYSQLFHGMNFQYPLTLRWDTSLYHAPDLPEEGIGVAVLSGEYFWQAGYSELAYGTMDMTIRDSIVLYNIGYPFFGSRLIFADSSTMSIKGASFSKIQLHLVGTSLYLSAAESLQEVDVYDNQGRRLRHEQPGTPQASMDLGGLPSAIYLLQIRTNQNQWYHEKIFYAAP